MKDWHRDYIAGSIRAFETDGLRDDPSFDWFSMVAPGCPRLADHARSIAFEAGEAHQVAVCESVRAAAAGAMNRGGHPQFSEKQGFVVGRLLAVRYGTARALASALYGLTDEEVNNA